MKKYKIKIQKNESWDDLDNKLIELEEEVKDKISDEYYYINEVDDDLKAKNNYEIEINIKIKKKK